MACPRCGCKTTYDVDAGDDADSFDDWLQRCAACGHIFNTEDHTEEDDDDDHTPR